MEQKFSISVDKDFARFGGKAYAINKINSVEVTQRHPHGQAPVFLWGLLSLGCLLSFAGGAGGGVFVFAVIFGVLAYFAWRRSQIIEYQLFLRTSSRDAQALTSRDGSLIESLRDRIERAMAGQLA